MRTAWNDKIKPNRSGEMGRSRRGMVRFSLCAMALIVAAITVWLGFQMKRMNERAKAISWIEKQAAFWEDLPVEQGAKLDEGAPFPLALIGAPGVKKACVCIADKGSVAIKQRELERLFPEADILVVSPGPGYRGKHVPLVK